MSASPYRPVSLHIDRLIIDCPGMSRVEAVRFERAMCAELVRLAAEWPGGLPLNAGAAPGRSAPPVRVGAPLRPAEFGRQVARSLFDAMAEGS